MKGGCKHCEASCSTSRPPPSLFFESQKWLKEERVELRLLCLLTYLGGDALTGAVVQ